MMSRPDLSRLDVISFTQEHKRGLVTRTSFEFLQQFLFNGTNYEGACITGVSVDPDRSIVSFYWTHPDAPEVLEGEVWPERNPELLKEE